MTFNLECEVGSFNNNFTDVILHGCSGGMPTGFHRGYGRQSKTRSLQLYLEVVQLLDVVFLLPGCKVLDRKPAQYLPSDELLT